VNPVRIALACLLLASSLGAQTLIVHPKLDTTVVHPKDHVTVPIVLAGDVGAVQMTVSYATTRLTFDSLRAVDPKWTVTSNTTIAGKIVWNAFGVPGVAPPIIVARAYFTVKSPLGPTSLTPTLAVVGTMRGTNVTTGYTTERVILCVRASGTVC